jgi:hypothetical protein
MKRIGLYLAIILLSLASTGWKAGDEKFIIDLARTMMRYNENYPLERVYVHLDKQFYQPGEPIWFKAYISSTLSDNYHSLSSDLFIKVFDVFGNELVWKRYPVENNTAAGVIPIPSSVEEGKFLLTAFTGWMKNMEVTDVFPVELIISKNVGRKLLIYLEFAGRNISTHNEIEAILSVHTPDHKPAAGATYAYSVNIAGEVIEKGKSKTDDQGTALINLSFPDYAADKMATINIEVKYSGDKESILKHIPLVSDSIDLKFYPEGGNIVAGLENRIAFRVTDSHGFPLGIKGSLYDAGNKQVKHIESNGTGMGVFKLNPARELYKIKIDSPIYINREFPLPEIAENGLLLTYEGIRDGSIILTASFPGDEEIHETYWVGRMNNKMYWGTIIRMKGSRTIEIPLINFPPGIIQINVFNQDRMNIAQRFIYPGETDKMIIEATTDKKIYGTREKVTVRLTTNEAVRDSIKTDLSLSVVNKNLVGRSYKYQSVLNPHSINCRLSDETVSFISRIGYDEFMDNADLFMMSLGTRGPTYSDVLSTGIFRHQPYHNQDGLSGTVIDNNGNPLGKTSIILTHTPDMHIFETTSSENGVFNILFGNMIIDFNSLMLAVSDNLISQVARILVDNNFPDRIVGHFKVTDETWETQKIYDLIAYGNPDILYTGKYRRQKKEKIYIEQKKDNTINYSSYASVLDIINQIKQFTLINNQIVFQGGINSVYNQQGALIVLDRMQMGTDISVLESISTCDIENINISTNIADIHSYTGLNSQGIIEITTKKGKYNAPAGSKADSESAKEDNYGEFDSPGYGQETDIDEDIRTTLYWNSSIAVNAGEITEISFYTSDIRGEYTGRIEGLRSDGIPLSGQLHFKVE